jgi:SHAQKYF class myb-like DNA-binding protein
VPLTSTPSSAGVPVDAVACRLTLCHLHNDVHGFVRCTGRWTREEHAAFVEGLRLYGKEWKKVAKLIPTRTVVQIRTHAQKYFQKVSKEHGGMMGDGDDDTFASPRGSVKVAAGAFTSPTSDVEPATGGTGAPSSAHHEVSGGKRRRDDSGARGGEGSSAKRPIGRPR